MEKASCYVNCRVVGRLCQTPVRIGVSQKRPTISSPCNLSLLRWRALSLEPFQQNHICPGGAVAHLARLAIRFAVQPLFSTLR